MTSRKSEKKLDLKVKRVLKTNVRGGVAQYQGLPIAGGAAGSGLVAASEEGQTQVGSGRASKGSSYPSRMPGPEVGIPGMPGLPGGGIIKGSL
jgi:hypothetical protein